jgi:nucleotide-binding universal stress UspA family protein
MNDPGVARVLVPIDFSERCVAVIKWAQGVIDEDGQVIVIHVVPPLAPADPAVLWGKVDDGTRLAAVKKTMTSWLAEKGLSGVQIETAIGVPGPTITEKAGTLDIDLVALPSHRRDARGLFSLGSVAERVVRSSPCPVWVSR